ncbi:hypothetical protein [Alcaligenes phenolicus]
MTTPGIPTHGFEPVTSASERLIRGLSLYVIPLFLIMLTLWALLFLPNRYPTVPGQSLGIQALASQQEHADPELLTQLENAPTRQRLHLSEPHWLLLTLPAPFPQQDQVLHFPASPISSLHCQDARSGQALRNSELDPPTPLSPAPVKSYTLELGQANHPDTVLCRVETSRPTLLQAQLWASADVTNSSIRLRDGLK